MSHLKEHAILSHSLTHSLTHTHTHTHTDTHARTHTHTHTTHTHQEVIIFRKVFGKCFLHIRAVLFQLLLASKTFNSFAFWLPNNWSTYKTDWFAALPSQDWGVAQQTSRHDINVSGCTFNLHDFTTTWIHDAIVTRETVTPMRFLTVSSVCVCVCVCVCAWLILYLLLWNSK